MFHDRNPRVLITRLSHIGDCIQTVPLLCAARSRFPQAFIAWAIESPATSLIEGHKDLDQLIVVPRRWLKSIKTIRSIRRQLGELQFDVALDPQGLTKSSALGWLSGAESRIGFTRGSGRELSPLFNNILVTPSSANVVDQYQELLRPFGETLPQVNFDLPISQESETWAQSVVRDSGLSEGFVILNPGAGWHSRRWEMDRFAAVARYLGRKYNLRSLVSWAGDDERRMAERITELAPENARMAPATTLVQLGSLLRCCRFYFGSDTGPMHLAVAVGVRCVCLHGTTRADRSGPHGPGHVTVQAYYQDGSSRQRRNAGNDALRAITVEMAYRACDQIVELADSKDQDATAA